MCVIMVANKVRPSDEMIDKAWKANDDGAGIAWREGEGRNKEVVWQKGVMNLEEIRDLIKNVPMPFVVHFRVASVGGIKPSLTHPFIVNRHATLELNGRTKGSVLFHNGHWSAWQDKALDAAIHSNTRVPEGSDWSDTRAIAWMVHIYGAGFMELLSTQKGVLMSPNGMNVFTGNGWEKVNDVWCSNDLFWKRSYGTVTTYRRVCHVGHCKNQAQAGKDICESCEQLRMKAAAEVAGNATAGEKKINVSPVEVATGDSRGPFAQTLTLEEVEKIHKVSNLLVSKSTLKKYRRAVSEATEKGNRGLRAQAKMRQLSERIAEALVTGSAVS